MRNSISAHRGNVIPFPRNAATSDGLTRRDKQDIEAFRAKARLIGYDALMIHAMKGEDCPGTTDYMAAYRAGELWSTWGFARDADLIHVWDAVSAKDCGTFATMAAALERILASQAETLVPAEAQPGCQLRSIPSF